MPVIKLKYYFFLSFFLLHLCFIQNANAQLTEAQARVMLDQKGISEDTLRNRLIKKGYDPDKIRPDQVDKFQIVILETIREIEADAARGTSQNQSTAPAPVQPSEPPVIITPPATTTPISANTGSSPGAPIYGQEIFRNNSIQVYQKTDDIVPSDDYILGTGDKLGIVLFGRSQFSEILEIGADGMVGPSGQARTVLKGLRFSEAREVLFQRYNQYYSMGRGQFQVTLTQPRNITVNVFGEARIPGSYTLPGSNTAFNVISAAGGPTNIGSVRRIKVISGSQVRALDVYEYMNDPGVARNFFLQNNDVIHIPVAEKVISIQGAITRPMKYELLDSENLTQLIRYAGGVLPEAYLSDVKVTRFLDDRQVITNVNYRDLTSGGGDYILYDGDIVEIKSIEDNVINYVNVSGAVQFPGRYERRPDMRISDVLEQVNLKPEARLDFAYLLRYQPDGTFKYQRVNLQSILNDPASPENILLGDQDELQILTLKTYANQSYFSVAGAVRVPDTFAFSPQGIIRLEEAILLAGGLQIEAADHGYIMRFDPSEPKTIKYVQVNFRDAFNNPASAANIEIEAGDHIVVYDKRALRDDLTVAIHGAVRKPGNYAYGPEMTIADLVNLAGGFAFGADNERIDVARSDFGSRDELRITQYTAQLPPDFNLNQSSDSSLPLMPFDNVYVRYMPEFELQQTVLLRGEVKYPGTYTILSDNERIADVIERAGGLTGEAFAEGAKMYRVNDSTGLVVINLERILRNENEPSNVALHSGDVIDVPKTRDLVTIGGLVNLDDAYSDGFLRGQNSISVAFRGERSAKYYIDNFAAGVSEAGSPSEIKVQYADGRVQKTKKFFFFNDYPVVEKGAIITVGPKKIEQQREEEREKVDWGTILKDSLAQATAVLTILILVDQLGK